LRLMLRRSSAAVATSREGHRTPSGCVYWVSSLRRLPALSRTEGMP